MLSQQKHLFFKPFGGFVKTLCKVTFAVLAILSIPISVSADNGISNPSLVKTENSLTIAVETFEPVEEVKAEVTIIDGSIIKSNCEELSTLSTNRISYSLQLKGQSYMCVPNKSKLSKIKHIYIPIEHDDLTIENIRELIHRSGEEYESSVDRRHKLFSKENRAARCKLDENGNVDSSSCLCPSIGYSFDTSTKKCELNSNTILFYANSCSETQSNLSSILKIVGSNLIPPPSIMFGSCGVDGNIFKVIPHLLVYKMLFFAYHKWSIEKAIENYMEFENIRIFVSNEEINDYQNWISSFSSSEYSSKLLNEARKLEKMIKYRLTDIVEME